MVLCYGCEYIIITWFSTIQERKNNTIFLDIHCPMSSVKTLILHLVQLQINHQYYYTDYVNDVIAQEIHQPRLIHIVQCIHHEINFRHNHTTLFRLYISQHNRQKKLYFLHFIDITTRSLNYFIKIKRKKIDNIQIHGCNSNFRQKYWF